MSRELASVPESVCIVGAGAAGVAVASGLRRRHFDGKITFVDADADALCDKPPLSKQVLAGEWEPQRAQLLTEKRRMALDAEWLLGARATGLDLDRRVIQLASGNTLGFSQLAIATGVAPRRLPGSDGAGVHVLRTLGDALALKRYLTPATAMVIIGAGFLGLEVAATARKLGAAVTVVEPIERPLATRVGDVVASRLLAVHRAQGVRVLTGIGVNEVRNGAAAAGGSDGHSRTVVLTNGERLDCDLLLAAVGCAPSLDWLADSGLDLEDGVLCDEYCSAAPGVWAAGDVARWFHPRLGHHVRFEHRLNAGENGDVVAANMLGERRSCIPVPFFWTDHYDVTIQMVGRMPISAGPTTVEGDPNGDSFVLVFREPDDPRTVGAVGWNAKKRMTELRVEIEASW